ncbi:uncharacterized protein [Montipora foliosa]|uniref:uncharacterized protein isoform X1 n=1 Tax=Montipora foliosa TaxID=591990 RepID=UPI0035F12043
MASRGFVSALSLLRGTKSRKIAPSVRISQCFGRRSMSGQASAESGSHVPSMHHVSPMDRITLILTKTMKTPIPTEVPAATMEVANSRRRIGINVIMGTVFLVGAIWIIKISQKGRKEHTLVSLHDRNVQRYENGKEEVAAVKESH